MLATHIFNIPEIDAQHEVIFAQLRALQAALSDQQQAPLIQPALQQLRALLVAHFASEESFMDEHRRKHRDMLDLLDGCLAGQADAGRSAETINALIDSLRSHEFQNPDIAW